MPKLGIVALQCLACFWSVSSLGANNFGFPSILLQILHRIYATKPSSPTTISTHGKQQAHISWTTQVFSYDLHGFFSRDSTNSIGSFPFLLLLGLLFEPRLIILLLKVTCTLDATWSNKFEVTFGSSLKNNLNLKFFSTWRGAMALKNPRMNVKYKCRNPSLRLVTKAKGLQGCGPRLSSRVTFSCPRECKRVGGKEPSHSQMNSHVGSWNLKGLPNVQRAIARLKPNGSRSFLYQWKAIET